ncbi:uncharacterized protein L969DRAFT_91400 [Mixia osmundae IAM 14324]|uniref:RRM domain-containing protein n=1 Tax=Mixia osmundae (strain CBS 9802 / IAM 14324 / JCM 22182 / KY 12970) TaxID=764103 RepID=G7E3S5_MIXOS|nr:uncharacterized protein L969DRAFT_91400 [Mixia osmundae IAM 14324]KEI41931.1 hypothetical protein L969DRAFT_91400 [Mixia osmundae IAM 14324]GAA97485.1 hypothetical protein E5Q_04163 [Mixia osmundae IAM 14324]
MASEYTAEDYARWYAWQQQQQQSAGGSSGAVDPSFAYPQYDGSSASASTSASAQHQAAVTSYYPSEAITGGYDVDLAAQQSIYTPEAARSFVTSNKYTKAMKGKARTTVLRKGAGEVWEDPSLMEWDPAHFRLFIGDLGNDVNDETLLKSFGKEAGYPSFVKAKVVRDKTTMKTKGFGFVSYSDPDDFLKAWKTMNGKYVGSRPVKITKATTQVRAVDIGARKAREIENNGKKTHITGNKFVGRGSGVAVSHGNYKPVIRR